MNALARVPELLAQHLSFIEPSVMSGMPNVSCGTLALMMIWTEFPGENFDGRSLAELSLRELLPSSGAYFVVYGVALLILVLSAWNIGRKMARLRSLEKKKEAEGEIKSREDALNSGKKA